MAPEGSSTRDVDSRRGGITTPDTGAGPAERLHKGRPLESQLGNFKVTGELLTFYAPSIAYRLIALENLNLERISRLVDDNSSVLQWSVSGSTIEYHGVNFLLIDRAVLNWTTSTERPSSP